MTAPNADLTDRQLVEQSQRGDPEAYGVLVQRYQRLVLSVAYRAGAGPDSAMDVAQDTFLRAWQALPGFEMRGESAFRAWVCRIASNRAVDVNRQQRFTAPLEAALDTGAADPQETVARQVTSDMVREALQRLPSGSRQALVLREYGGLSYQEISQALDIPVGTVMSRLHYARTWLRRELAPYLDAEAEN